MDPTIPEEDSSFDANITTDNITNDATPMAAITVTLPTAEESVGYTVTANGTPTAGTDFTFKVEAKTGYTISKVQYVITTQEGENEPVVGAPQDATGTAPDYTVPGSAITETATAIEIKVEAAKNQYDLVVKVDEKDGASSAANLDVLTYSAGGQNDVAITDLTTPIKITHDDTLTLKVVPKDGYAVEVKNGTTKLTGTADGVYTVGKVTGAVTINITTSKNKFTVTEVITKGGDPEAELAVIAYENNCVASGKIAKGTALQFRVNPPTGGSFDGKKVIVSYKVGADGVAEPLTPKSNVYSVAAANITDDITIEVVVRDKENVTVSLDAANEHVEKVEYSTATPDSWQVIGNDGLTVPEDTTVRIKVTAAKYYKVKAVKFGDTPLTLASGMYSFEAGETAAISVETELDSAQCNKFTYKLTGDAGSVAASISVSENSTEVEDKNNIEAGIAQIIAGNKVVLKLVPKTGYKITKVDSATPNATTPLEYTYDYTGTGQAKIVTVATAPVANETEKQIHFNNQAANMSYKVTGDSKVSVSENNIDVTVGAGAERLLFNVTAQGPYQPTVKQNETEIPSNTRNGAVYNYIIPAATLNSGDTINITQEVIEHTVTLKEDFANANILASVDGKKRNTDNDTTDKYTLKENETIAFQIAPKDGYKLVSVTSQVGTAAAKTEKLTNGVANLEVKVSADVSVTVKTEEIYTVSKLKKDGTELTPADAKKNAYNVSYDGTYTVDVTKGVSTAALKAVKVFSGRNLVAEKTEGTAYATVSGGTATIDLAKAKDVAGKSGLTVKFYVAGETAADEVELSTTLTLNVSALVKDIKINNKAPLAVNQAIDTTQTYKVTAAKGVELSKLTVTSTDANGILADNGVTYDGTTGTLTVKTKAAKPAANATATITVHEAGKNGADDPKAVLTVTPVDLVPTTTKAPGVKLVAATDISLKLALSTTVKENPATGKLYYKVETQEMNTAVKPAVAVANTQKTAYVLKGTGLSQEAVITVAAGNLGDGSAKTYEVKASLVHLDKEADFESDGTLKTGIAVLGTSAASKAQNLKTQTPAYEDKLKLKKGKTTLATGEKEVIIATPQFSKYATYLFLANDDTVKDLSYPGENNASALKFDTPSADSNYVIKASATETTALGKHKIQVTASAETGALPSVATVDVTVVRGIHKLNVAVPSTNLYKANKKAATLKATAVYNEDTTGKDKDKQPKNKKVDWAVVAVDGNGDVQTNSGEDVLFTGASVKNGTVTVDKNYIIKGDDYSDKFKIRVTAQNTDKSYAGMDEDGNAIVGYSDVITITNVGEDIKGLVLVDSDSKIVVGGGTAKFPTAVEATDLAGCKLVVLNSAAPSPAKGTAIEDGHKLAYTNFTVKCSQKGLLGNDGALGAVSKMGKVTFTATANDGSKKKAELAINIINDDTKNKALSLKVQKALYQADGTKAAVADGILYSPNTAENPAGATTAKIDFDGSTTPLVAVTLVMADAKTATENWAEAPKYANYKLSVSGGGKIVEKGITTYIAITNNTDVVVTLEDPVNSTSSNKIKDTFTLKNKATTEAPKFTAGKLKSVGKFSEQTADIKVEKMTAAVESTAGLKAKIEVDWSAANAKNQTDLQNFQGYLESSYDVTVAEVNSKKVGTINFALKGDAGDEVKLPQSSYKLKITLGTVANDVFTAVTTPVVVTVKVDKAKAFTFTPATSYTLFTKDQNASTPLTGKTNAQENEYNVTYTTLLNANVKGVTNDFTDYFEIADDKIQLKSGKKIADITKANLTGYLTYTANPTVGYYTLGKGAGTNTVKITIKFNESKTAAAYSQIKTNNKPDEIAKTSGSTVDVKIQAKVGKETTDAKLAYVAVAPKNAEQFGAVVKTDGSNVITLTYKGTEALSVGREYSVDLLILPSDSWYKAEIDALGTDAAKAEAVIAKNIKVTVKLKAVEVKTPMDTAKEKLGSWIDAQNTAKPAWLKNGLTSADLLTKISAEQGGAGLDTGVTVAIAKKTTDANADDYDNTTNLATVAAVGKITGTFKISITGTPATEDTLAFTLNVPKGAITKDEAKAEIEKADGAVKAIEVTNEDTTDADKKSAKEAAILAAAKTALGGDTYYTVTVKADAGLTQTQAATNEAAGSATITLEIKETGNTGDTAKEVMLTYTIAQITGA